MQPELMLSRFESCGIYIPFSGAQTLARFHDLLTRWNAHMDLTNITGDTQALDRHYVDSLMPLTVQGMIPPGASLIDVGTGAGFPGIVLAIARPDLSVTLIDAQQKRVAFLNEAIQALSLPNVRAMHLRAEEGARLDTMRERFDLACARAVAPSPVLLEYLLPYVKVGGQALLWKGPAAAQEYDMAKRAAFQLGGKLQKPVPMPVPGQDWQHVIIPCQKVQKTLRQFPRKSGTPSKHPLG